VAKGDTFNAMEGFADLFVGIFMSSMLGRRWSSWFEPGMRTVNSSISHTRIVLIVLVLAMIAVNANLATAICWSVPWPMLRDSQSL
jgi:hypothetical protein